VLVKSEGVYKKSCGKTFFFSKIFVCAPLKIDIQPNKTIFRAENLARCRSRLLQARNAIGHDHHQTRSDLLAGSFQQKYMFVKKILLVIS